MDPSLNTLLTEAGMQQEGIDFITALGNTKTSILATIATSTDKLTEIITTPFEEGKDIGGTIHKLTTSPAVWRCVVQVAWENARAHRSKELSDMGPVTPAASVPATSTSSKQHKPPKDLPPGVWSSQIRAWENKYTPPRTFPQELLIGAEAVLARIWWEHTESKAYTPIKLGEILSLRSFTSSGMLNPLSNTNKDKENVLGLDSSGQLTELKPSTWDPRGLLSVLDALEAIRWALIWADLGDEGAVGRWIDHFVKLARNRTADIHAVKALWDAASWKVSLQMRTGSTFTVATKTLLDTPHYFTEYLNNSSPSTSPSPKKRPRPFSTPPPFTRPRLQLIPGPKGKGKTGSTHRDPTPKGKGKGKSKGKGKPEVCRNFNEGRCQDPRCSRTHACSVCGKLNHSAKECWSQ
jgi:hypothetical protein